MFKSYPLLPVNVTWFRESLHRYKQVKMRPYWLHMGPNPDTGDLLRGKFGHRHRENALWPQRQRGGVMPPQAKKCQGLPTITRKLRDWCGIDSPLSPWEGTNPAWLGTSGLQNWEKINIYCYKPPSLCSFVTAVLGNQFHDDSDSDTKIIPSL